MTDCVVLPFPSRAKPRAYTDTLPVFSVDGLSFDPDPDLPMGYFSSDLRSIEPRTHFGLRDRVGELGQRARDAADAPAVVTAEPSAHELVEKASDLADEIVSLLRRVARATGKPRFHLLAQDAEQMSERLCHALAEQA